MVRYDGKDAPKPLVRVVGGRKHGLAKGTIGRVVWTGVTRTGNDATLVDVGGKQVWCDTRYVRRLWPCSRQVAA
jgi:hypothetical protein